MVKLMVKTSWVLKLELPEVELRKPLKRKRNRKGDDEDSTNIFTYMIN